MHPSSRATEVHPSIHGFIYASSCRRCDRSEPGKLGGVTSKVEEVVPQGEEVPPVIEGYYSTLHTNVLLMLPPRVCETVGITTEGCGVGR